MKSRPLSAKQLRWIFKIARASCKTIVSHDSLLEIENYLERRYTRLTSQIKDLETMLALPNTQAEEKLRFKQRALKEITAFAKAFQNTAVCTQKDAHDFDVEHWS